MGRVAPSRCGRFALVHPPLLVDAAPRSLLQAEEAALVRAKYGLTYALAPGPGGSCALQRVETQVQLLRGEEPLLEYEAVYWEYYRFAMVEELRLDRHDFSAARDGWSPCRVGRLLRHHRLPGGSGPTRLRVRKRFLLGPGQVQEGGIEQLTPGGGVFGYLEEAEGERPWVRLRLRGEPLDDAALPLPIARGGGALTAGADRLVAEERLEFGYATLSGLLTRVSYRQAPRAEQALI